MEQLLKQFGFTEPQRLIYQALLKSGGATVTELSHLTGLKRTSCQEYLRSLQEQGFVNASKIKKKYYYQAEDPDKFLQLANERVFLADRFISALGEKQIQIEPWEVRMMDCEEAENVSRKLAKKQGKLKNFTTKSAKISIGKKEVILISSSDMDLPAMEIKSESLASFHRNILY